MPAKSRFHKKKLIAAIALLPLVFIACLPGCTAEKQVRVKQATGEAGKWEPGTKVAWIKGGKTKGEKEILEDPDGQWSVSAEASSNFGDVSGLEGWDAGEATGPPDVEKFWMDKRAWGPAGENDGYEWLELTYERPVHATGIRIRELHGFCTVMVQLKDVNGKYHLKWKGSEESRSSITWFMVDFPDTKYLAGTVRLTLDTTRTSDWWKQIDSVQLVGSP